MSDLRDGESIEVKGSAAKPYVLKNVGGVYSCTCPAWRNQSVAIERRTCKHLRKLRGEAAEKERVGGELPARAQTAAKAKDAPPLLLAHNWDNAMNLAEWWMSEKLDGVRAYWTGERFLSRQGNTFHAPDWFIAGLPDTPLDGELWIDRKKFQRTVSIVRRQDKSELWQEVRYLVFDAPQCPGSFEERMEFLIDSLPPRRHEFASVHQHERCTGLDHLQEELQRVEAEGGEGLMLREPGSGYEVGRSTTLLKVKTFHDAEAAVIDHVPGKGKHKGKLGALLVQLPDGTEFSVGTGFSDAQRAAPPAIGSKITFRYQEFSDGGVPRFPSFVRLNEGSVSVPATSSKTRGKPAGKSKAGSKPAARSASKKAAVSSTAATANGPARYFEYSDDKSNKFWEIRLAGAEVTVRYGRIGSNGTTKTKELASSEAAAAHADKLISEKQGKGYVEKAS